MTSLILIEGPANTGKTTIAWKVYLKLREYATSVRFFDYYDNELSGVDDIIRATAKNLAQDFYAVLTIRNQTFVIDSFGDKKPQVEWGVEWGWQMRVDGIIQCAQELGTIQTYIAKECGNMPKVEYHTQYHAVPADQAREQDDITDAIVKCVMEP